MMNVISKKLLCTFLSLLMLGCAGGHRLYSGNPRVDKEVAIIIMEGGTRVQWAQEGNQEGGNCTGNEVKVLLSENLLEILPGLYTLGIGFSDNAVMGKGWLWIKLDAKPGHNYVTYPTFRPGTWQANVVDITDYSRSDCPTCSDRKSLENTVQDYFNMNKRDTVEIMRIKLKQGIKCSDLLGK